MNHRPSNYDPRYAVCDDINYHDIGTQSMSVIVSTAKSEALNGPYVWVPDGSGDYMMYEVNPPRKPKLGF